MSPNENGTFSDDMSVRSLKAPHEQASTSGALAIRNPSGPQTPPFSQAEALLEQLQAKARENRALRADLMTAEANIEVLRDNVFKLRKEKMECQDIILRLTSQLHQLKNFKQMILNKARITAPHSDDMIKAVAEGNYDWILEQRAFVNADNVGRIKDKIVKDGKDGHLTFGGVKAKKIRKAASFAPTSSADKPTGMTLEEELFGPPITKADNPERIGVKQMMDEGRRLSQDAKIWSEEKLAQEKPLPAFEKDQTFRDRMRTLRKRVSQVFVKED